MDVTKTKIEIDEIISKLQSLRNSLETTNLLQTTVKALELDSNPTFEIPSDDIGYDELVKLLNSEEWPKAVHKNMICDPTDEDEKVGRGRGIVELMIDKDIGGKKVLDFGCGEGHSTDYISSRSAKLSVGYDIKNQNWTKIPEKENLMLTTSWGKVVENGPYDLILAHDTLDHLVGDTLETAYAKMSEVIVKGGFAFVRHHPFTSRHALHTYHELNKAFVHLVFRPEERERLLKGMKYLEPNLGVCYPLFTYQKLSENNGFAIVNRRDIKDVVEGFFKKPMIAKRIYENTGMPQFPEFQMTMQFIDYQLEKK